MTRNYRKTKGLHRLRRSNDLRSAKTRSNRRARSAKHHSIPEARGNLTQARLNALILAAIKVWELQKGIG